MSWKPLATLLVLMLSFAPTAKADHPKCAPDGEISETYCDLPHPVYAQGFDRVMTALCGDPAGVGCVRTVEALTGLSSDEPGPCWTNFQLPYCF